jgi:hypothetical protein
MRTARCADCGTPLRFDEETGLWWDAGRDGHPEEPDGDGRTAWDCPGRPAGGVWQAHRGPSADEARQWAGGHPGE